MRNLIVVAAALCVIGGTIGCGKGEEAPSTTPIETKATGAPKAGAGSMQAAPVPTPGPATN